MNKWLCLFLIITTSSVYGSSLREEITSNKIIRSILRISVVRAYQDYTDIHGDVRPLQVETKIGTTLVSEELDKYFHDEAGFVLPGYKNSFEGGEVRGCIYSIDDQRFRNKIFISFPGTQSLAEWAKNFFGITHFDNNIQRSYHQDINNLYAHNDQRSFITALRNHINFVNNDYQNLNNNYQNLNNNEMPDNFLEYEYYFTGHSRGGGLAAVTAKIFKERYEELQVGHVKLATFCTPRLTNAYSAQSKFINLLGYDNIVHFVRPFDLAPKFPFQFVENQGAKILLQPGAFWSIKQSHRVPDQKEMEDSVGEYNIAKGIGWLYPIRNLFTLEPKPLLWGFGGACITLFLVKTSLGSLVSGEIKEMYIRMLRRI